MKQNLFFAFTLMAALTGCSQSEYSPENNASVEICLGSATGIVPGTTRAPIQGSTSPTITAKVLLSGTSGAYTTDTDVTNRFFDGMMNFSDGNVTGFSETKQYYPFDGSSVYLCGLYPSTGWETISKTSTSVYTFDGKTDVMAAPEVATNKTDAQGAKDYKTLAFNHLLTNLIIKAKVDAATGAPAAEKIQALWGNITEISLQEAGGATPNNQVMVDLKGGSTVTDKAFSGGTAVPFYTATGTAFANYTYEDSFKAIAIPATESAIAYSLIAPIEAKGDPNVDFKLLVKTVNNPAGTSVSVSLSKTGDTQGQYCEITLTFKTTEINANATIADWTQGGDASGSLQ